MEHRLDEIIGDLAARIEDRRGFRLVLRELIAVYSSQPPTLPHYCNLKVTFISVLFFL